MASNSRIPGKILTLKQFMLRQEVLKLYREVLRTAYKAEKDQRVEIITWARNDFEQHRKETNEESIKSLVNYGKQMLKELQSTLRKST